MGKYAMFRGVSFTHGPVHLKTVVLAAAALSTAGCAGSDSTASAGAPQPSSTAKNTTSNTPSTGSPSTSNAPLTCDKVVNGTGQSAWLDRDTERRSKDPDHCDYRCNAGWADCDGDASNGCEADLSKPEVCAQCLDALLLGLCASPAKPDNLSSLAVEWAGLNPNISGLATGPNDEIVVSIETDNWGAMKVPLYEGPSVQVSDENADLVWNMRGADSGGEVAVSRDYIYLVSHNQQTLYQLSKDGMVLWTRQLPGISGGSREINTILVDEAQNVYVYGLFEDQFKLDGVVSSDAVVPEGYVASFTPDNKLRWLFPGKKENDTLARNTSMALSGNKLYLSERSLYVLDADKGTQLQEFPLPNSNGPLGSIVVAAPAGGVLVMYGALDFWDYDSSVGLVAPATGALLTTPHAGESKKDPSTLMLVRYDSALKEQWRTHFGDDRTKVSNLVMLPSEDIAFVASQTLEGKLSRYVVRLDSKGQFQSTIKADENVFVQRIAAQVNSGSLVVAISTEGISPSWFPDADPKGKYGMVGILP